VIIQPNFFNFFSQLRLIFISLVLPNLMGECVLRVHKRARDLDSDRCKTTRRFVATDFVIHQVGFHWISLAIGFILEKFMASAMF
jgi:hypothetical protein